MLKQVFFYTWLPLLFKPFAHTAYLATWTPSEIIEESPLQIAKYVSLKFLWMNDIVFTANILGQTTEVGRCRNWFILTKFVGKCCICIALWQKKFKSATKSHKIIIRTNNNENFGRSPSSIFINGNFRRWHIFVL